MWRKLSRTRCQHKRCEQQCVRVCVLKPRASDLISYGPFVVVSVYILFLLQHLLEPKNDPFQLCAVGEKKYGLLLVFRYKNKLKTSCPSYNNNNSRSIWKGYTFRKNKTCLAFPTVLGVRLWILSDISALSEWYCEHLWWISTENQTADKPWALTHTHKYVHSSICSPSVSMLMSVRPKTQTLEKLFGMFLIWVGPGS